MLSLDDLAQLAEKHADVLGARVREFSIGDRCFPFNARPAIMGVINLSPNSWYRESVCLSVEKALQRGRVLAGQGADLIDVGAESTLAHAARAPGQEQKSKLLPVIKGLRSQGLLVSIETYLPEVAESCLEAGANVLNLTGRQAVHEIYPIVARHQAALILCHVQGANVREVDDLVLPADAVGALYEYFARAIEVAQSYGIEKILIDPGLGFYYRNLQDSASRIRFQMEVFLNSFRLRALGFPVCHALPHAFEFFGEEVRSAEAFFAVLAAIGKTDLFRTHEVSRVRAVLSTLSLFGKGPAFGTESV